jgi:hypothetical protein
VYFLGLLACIDYRGRNVIFRAARAGFLPVIAILVFGAIMVRVYSELLILLFRIHDNLVSINQQMKDRNSSGQL